MSDVGYCNEHDRVYSGPECPDCTDGSAELDDAAVQSPSQADADTGDDPDDGTPGSITDSIEETIAEATENVSVDSEGGDVVVGDQEKVAESSKNVHIDNSETHIDESEEVHDDRTVVEDSVLKDADVGTDGPTVRDSVAQDSSIASGTDEPVESTVSEPTPPRCPGCGEEVSADDAFCMQCGNSLQDS